jgi:hypothetical protein
LSVSHPFLCSEYDPPSGANTQELTGQIFGRPANSDPQMEQKLDISAQMSLTEYALVMGVG